MIAFTNHALDHMLRSVLDAGITKKIVRMGSQSKDERISQYSLDNLQHIADRSKLHQVSNSQYRELKLVEEEIKQLLKDFSKSEVDYDDIISHLDISYGGLYVSLTNPPQWISILFDATRGDDGEGAWQRAGQKGKAEEDNLWTFWRDGRDLEFLRKPDEKASRKPAAEIPPHPAPSTNPFSLLAPEVSSPSPEEDEDVKEDEAEIPVEEHWQITVEFDEPESEKEQEKVIAEDTDTPITLPPTPPSDSALLNPADLHLEDFFRSMGYQKVPLVPSTRLPIQELLTGGEMWSLSSQERQALCDYWTVEIRRESHETNLQEFNRLREKHAEALQRFNNVTNEVIFGV